MTGQDTLTFYFDDQWNEIQNKEEAVYYRKAFQVQEIWTVRDYFVSDTLQMTGTFKSKKLTVREGHFVYYYENGKKQSEGDYINDKHSGPWTYWYENGQKKSEGNCTAGNLEGIWTYYFESGEKKSEGKFIRNNRDGTWNFWYKSGKPEAVETYKVGFVTSSKLYYKNGNLNSEGEYLNGQKHGTWIFYNVDGRVYFSGKYVLGTRKGTWVRSFPDDQMTVNYEMGVVKDKEIGGIVRKKWSQSEE